jgi:tripeptidyl-peptidase-1
MLQVEFKAYKHVETGKVLVRSLEPYSAPSSIAEKIDFIAGINGFNVPHRIIHSAEETLQVGPTQLRERYNITAVGGKSAKNKMAVAEFQGQYYSPSDLKTFFQRYVKDSTKDTVAKVVGTNVDGDPGVEASLDIQYIMGVAPDVEAWFYSNPSFDFYSDLTSWVSQLSSETDLPQVHSVSYGSQGNYPSAAYRDRIDTEFQKLGARGVSIVFASGDSGTGCFICGEFLPSYPATSIYVTSVGATRFMQDAVGPEAAVEAFSSGGGFSLLFKQPSYQQTAVGNYFKSGVSLPPSFYYSKDGRGTPDVAALGIGFNVVVLGETESVGGTSAAAPTFSAVVALLNDIRLANGNSTLGFLNPFLYKTQASNSDAFFDVTVGDNQYGCCLDGFQCAKGWDPVSGLGTPNYRVLATLV